MNVERKGRFAFYSVNKDTIDLVASAILSLKSSSKKALKEKHGSEPDTGEKKGGKKKKKKDKNKKKKKD